MNKLEKEAVIDNLMELREFKMRELEEQNKRIKELEDKINKKKKAIELINPGGLK